MLLPDQSRQRRRRHRRITSQLDLGKSPSRVFGGIYQVADHGKLRSSAQTMAVHGRNRHLFAADQRANHSVKLSQHPCHFVRSMRGNIHAHRERFPRAAQYHSG